MRVLEGLDEIFLEDIMREEFLDKERLDVSRPFTILCDGEVDLPIEANLFNELERDDVENTFLINPFIPTFDLEDPVVSYFL